MSKAGENAGVVQNHQPFNLEVHEMKRSVKCLLAVSGTGRRLLAALATVALLVVGTGTNLARAAEPAVPFKADVAGSVSGGSTPETFMLVARGKASHMGKTAYEGSGVFTSDTSDTLTETLTAANGDTLTILCLQTLEDLGNGVLQGTDTWTVIGGTGRFSNATGSGTGDTYVHNLMTFTKHLTGAISYQKSNTRPECSWPRAQLAAGHASCSATNRLAQAQLRCTRVY